MCLKCGDMNHFDNSLFEKALDSGKLEKPRYKAIEEFEFEFKSQYKGVISKTLKQISDEFDY